MDTLIELFDERSIENVLGPEMFRPKRVVYLCPAEAYEDHKKKTALKRFFDHRGLSAELVFVKIRPYDPDHIEAELVKTVKRHPDCALDITGGNDAVLFAAGRFCSSYPIPVFTYSRRQNTFYNISNAVFADKKICGLKYKVEDFFCMTGGVMQKGRVDNRILEKYMDRYDPFFQIYFDFQKEWVSMIHYFQKVSQVPKGSPVLLEIRADYRVSSDHGGMLTVCPEMLYRLEEIGFLKEVSVVSGESISFSFADEQIRFWLRDIGSVLELYFYKVCKDLGIFQDVVSSAVVDWDHEPDEAPVYNEIDVVAVRNVIPLFISCKTCEIKTEALNELAILADRFGGKGAKAVIVTTEYCNAAVRHRAAQLGIAVIDKEELVRKEAAGRLRIIMKA